MYDYIINVRVDSRGIGSIYRVYFKVGIIYFIISCEIDGSRNIFYVINVYVSWRVVYKNGYCWVISIG